MVMIVPDIQFAKNKAAQTAAVSEAFGIDVSSCYTPCEVQNAKWELLQKMNQVKNSKKYNVSQDQLLIQRIGIASNLNVTIQNRFSMQNSTLRMYCNKCRSSLELYDSFEFQKSSDGLTDFLLTFCTAHRHEEYGVAVAAPVIQQASAESLLDGPIGGRKFRDD